MAHSQISPNPSVQTVLNKYVTSVLPLTASNCTAAPEAGFLRDAPAVSLFPGVRHPEASVSGLLLLLQDWEASHRISQEIKTPEGSYWHAIAHRMEPDGSNAAYWFRRVGIHPIFPELRERAGAILAPSNQPRWVLKPNWDPFLFIEWCDEARRRPGSMAEQSALAIQKTEWELLFHWCSEPLVDEA